MRYLTANAVGEDRRGRKNTQLEERLIYTKRFDVRLGSTVRPQTRRFKTWLRPAQTRLLSKGNSKKAAENPPPPAEDQVVQKV